MEGPISFWGYKEQESNLILPEHDNDDKLSVLGGFTCILLKRFYIVIHMFKIYYKLMSLLSYVWYLD